MSKWEMVKFIDIFDDVTSKAKKIPKEDYLTKGMYPIVDQGKSFIAGYSDDNNKLFSDFPIILFGDHTRILKFIDFPLFIGADGVKLLKCKFENVSYKYLYYVLTSVKIIDTGYNRHYKWLKESSIPLPPLETQKQIADELDKITGLIEKRKSQIEKLDLLTKAKFVEMFGDPVMNEMGWDYHDFGKVISLLTDFNANGSYEYLDSNVKMYDEDNYALMIRTTDLENGDYYSDVKYVDENAYNILHKSKIFGDEIIMSKIGSAGKVYLMPKLNRPVTLGRNAFLLRFSSEVNRIFIYYLLVSDYGKREISQHIRGAVTKTITKDAVRSILIFDPPLDLQNKFAEYVEKIEKTKYNMNKGLEQLEVLYKERMQEYFG